MSLSWLWVPPAIVAVVLVILALRLLQARMRRRRCPHDDVRLVRQQSGGELYYARVCMLCGEGRRVKP